MDPDTTMTTRQNVVGDEEHEHSHPADVQPSHCRSIGRPRESPLSRPVDLAW